MSGICVDNWVSVPTVEERTYKYRMERRRQGRNPREWFGTRITDCFVKM